MHNKAISIINKMLQTDEFSRLLGMQVLEVEPGYCKIKMKVTPNMVNGFGSTHGAITYALADSALAFSSNGYGNQCVSIETQISHLQKVEVNDLLIATAKELKRSNKIGWYEISVVNQHDVLVAHFKGTVYVTLKEWEV